ncbi:MAG: response regulator [Candidatus Rokuibacteriota bacterium]
MPTVMVIDDSLSVRKVVERALARKSIGVISAASGNEAIARLETEAPDVVVCDVVMPDRDGYQICEFVKTHPRLATTPVLLISGIVNNTVLERAARVNSNGVMGKPFAADDLLRKIDDLLAARAIGSGQTATDAPPEPLAMETSFASPPDTAADVGEASDGLDAPGEQNAEGGVADVLRQLGALPGVDLAVLVDREGFVVESTATTPLDPEIAGALASAMAEVSEGIGRELQRGALQGAMLEYERGTVLLHGAGARALLAVVVSDPSALGKVRYSVKKLLVGLEKAL